MIYPSTFPSDRQNEHAEKKVYERLRSLSDKYDVFYSRKFITDGVGKKPEFEIDFIIALPEKALVCIEVKGGLIDYSGADDVWKQNGHRLSSPISQVSGSTHSFLSMYGETIADMPVMWALCFPDCEMEHTKHFPSSVNAVQVIDALRLLNVEYALDDLFIHIQKTHSSRRGAKKWQYELFKKSLLRGLGFVQTLSTRIKYDEERFVELTELQLRFFMHVSENKNIIIDGPAGSGKTIIAKTLAQDFLNDGKSVLFMCFNRTLANKIRYDFNRDEKELKVCTFHSFSREIITEFEPDWWNAVDKSAEDFWDLEVPAKLESFMSFLKKKYDVLIIDEGQDFKQFWFDLIFQSVAEEGQKYIFLDKFQDIFGHFDGVPNQSSFTKFHLQENCRNTKSIVTYLETIVAQPIETFDRSPTGDDVQIESFGSAEDLILWLNNELKDLLSKERIQAEQILLILRSAKSESSLASCDTLAGFPLRALDNKARFQQDTINYSSINTFKGLEAPIVFAVDFGLSGDKKDLNLVYTASSRATNELYILSVQ